MKLKPFSGGAAALTLCLTWSAWANAPRPEVHSAHAPKILYRAVRLADTKMAENQPAEHPWDWTSGVFMIGLGQLQEYTGEPRYQDYYRAWIDYHLARGFAISRNDQIAPGLLCLLLYRQTHEPRYLEAAERIGRYILHEAVRTREGGLIHFGPVGGSQMWIDSLFMLGPFLVELSEATGDPAYTQEALRQCLIMYRHLQDPSGLCKHRWSEATGRTNPDHWLRGNGWAFAAAAVVLSHLPAEGSSPERDQLLARFQKQARALARHQAETGLWHTVIDEPQTYLESSGSALVIYGMVEGVRAGLLEKSCLATANRGLFGLLAEVRIHPDGSATMENISLGTRPGDAAYYNDVIRDENITFGVGAFLLATTSWLTFQDYRYQSLIMETETGWDHLRWGRLPQALAGFNRVAEAQPNLLSARLGAGLTEMILVVQEIEDAVADLSVQARGMTPTQFQTLLTEKTLPALARIQAHFAAVAAEEKFDAVIEQMVFAGTSAVGYMEWDRAEVLGLEAVAHLLSALAHLAVSYDLNGPPLLLARREFGQIVRDPHWPAFLSLTPAAPQHLPQMRLELIAALENFREVYSQTALHPNRAYGKPITPELLRLQGQVQLPGNIPPTPTKKLLSKNIWLRVVLSRIGPRLPERMPVYLTKSIRSLQGETIPLAKSVGLNLGAFFEHPTDLRSLFPEPLPDGGRRFPDPTLNGILPGMTNQGWQQLEKLLY